MLYPDSLYQYLLCFLYPSYPHASYLHMYCMFLICFFILKFLLRIKLYDLLLRVNDKHHGAEPKLLLTLCIYNPPLYLVLSNHIF